ncbi:MAG: hypothetical protein ACKO23_20350, partial [Gemmataceae bacterium]
MHFSLRSPLAPRNGQRLRVLGIARISTEHQDVRSLADQEALYCRWLEQNHGLPYDLTMIAGRGSGESLVRAEVQQATEAIETGTYDLVIT